MVPCWVSRVGGGPRLERRRLHCHRHRNRRRCSGWRSRHPYHPEMGHLRIPHDIRDSFAGNCPYHGDCFEGLAAWPAMQARWGKPARELPPDDPAWHIAVGLVNLMAPLLADKFVSTSSEGKVTHEAEFLAIQKSIKWSRAENIDVKVTVFGNTAIATGSEKFQGTDASGQPLGLNECWTDTWVKMPSGNGRCIASHQSPNKM